MDTSVWLVSSDFAEHISDMVAFDSFEKAEKFANAFECSRIIERRIIRDVPEKILSGCKKYQVIHKSFDGWVYEPRQMYIDHDNTEHDVVCEDTVARFTYKGETYNYGNVTHRFFIWAKDYDEAVVIAKKYMNDISALRYNMDFQEKPISKFI